jgi:hypothetical protein
MPKLAAANRRALEMLAAAQNGLSEGALMEEGVSIEAMVELANAGLVRAKRESLIIGGMPIEITRLSITKAGRRAL